jgi:hypothetical protein
MPVRVADSLVDGGPQDRLVRPGLGQFVRRRMRALMGPDEYGEYHHQQQRDAHEQGVDLENAHAANRIADAG